MKLIEEFCIPFPFLYYVKKNGVEIILPNEYPLPAVMSKIKTISKTFKIIYNSELYFKEFPIKDPLWRNLYAHFGYDPLLQNYFAEINKRLYYCDVAGLKIILKNTKQFLEQKFDLVLHDKDKSLEQYFENYIILEKLVNLYSVIDCCVVDELGQYKLNYEAERNNCNILSFLQDMDQNKNIDKYDPKLVELYNDIIKDTKNFCWYFGHKLLPLRLEFRKTLEKKTKIKVSDDIVNDWIPKIGKFIFGVDYDLKTHELRYPSYG